MIFHLPFYPVWIACHTISMNHAHLSSPAPFNGLRVGETLEMEPHGALCGPKRPPALLRHFAVLRATVGLIGICSYLINTSYLDVHQGYKVLTRCHVISRVASISQSSDVVRCRQVLEVAKKLDALDAMPTVVVTLIPGHPAESSRTGHIQIPKSGIISNKSWISITQKIRLGNFLPNS